MATLHSWALSANEQSLMEAWQTCRKWRVISHPLNTNPFPGSFLNYRGRLRLREVTLNNLTLVELEGGFDTEHAVSSPSFPFPFLFPLPMPRCRKPSSCHLDCTPAAVSRHAAGSCATYS